MTRTSPKLAFLLLVGLAFALPRVDAQFDLNGPNAAMRLQGLVPSAADPIDHDVIVPVPGIFEMTISTGANTEQPLILMFSPLNPVSGNVFPVPWGGSIDIGTNAGSLPGNIVLIGDGIGLSVGPLDFFYRSNQGSVVLGTPPQFVLNLATGSSLAGAHAAFQSIVIDPTMPPFNLDNTEAVDANFQNGQNLTVQPGSSGSIGVPFVSGKVFNFHGTSYTQAFICANGFISFGGPTSVVNSGFSLDALSLANSEPAIAIFNADWKTGTSNTVLWNEVGNSVRIAYGDPTVQPGGLSHFNDIDSNAFEANLELQDPLFSNANDGRFSISLTSIDPNAIVQNGSGILGHTPGGLAIQSPAADTDLHQAQNAGAGIAMLEEHDANGTNASNLGYDGAGSPRLYGNIHSWNGQSVTFTPNPWALVPGDLGYTSMPSAQAADDVRGTDPVGLDVAGNQIVTVVGKFWGFTDGAGLGGSVTFDPNGAALPGTVIGILDGTSSLPLSVPNNPATSPYRDGEGLVISTPVFSGTGPIDMRVDFFSGASITVQVNVVLGGSILTTYGLPNTASQIHNLVANTITFYGQTYTQMFLHSLGYITFGSNGSEDFSESLNELYAGWQATPTVTPRPGVALNWSDMNRNLANGMIEVLEDTTSGATSVTYKNQNHWVSFSPAGDSRVTFDVFGPNSLEFDHSAFLADLTPGTNTHSVIIGVTDGDSTVGINTNFTNGVGTGISGNLGTYVSPSSPNSFAESFPVGIQPALGLWYATDAGDGTIVPYGSWVLF